MLFRPWAEELKEQKPHQVSGRGTYAAGSGELVNSRSQSSGSSCIGWHLLHAGPGVAHGSRSRADRDLLKTLIRPASPGSFQPRKQSWQRSPTDNSFSRSQSGADRQIQIR